MLTYTRHGLSQQRLSGWRPEFSKTTLERMIISISITSLIASLLLLILHSSPIQVSDQYSSTCTDSLCDITLNIPETIKAPVYIYYELSNFHQNHRRYISSFSKSQLFDSSPSLSSLKSDCEPLVKGDDGEVLLPCGLLPNTIFNDSFVFSQDSKVLELDHDAAIWKREEGKYTAESDLDLSHPLFISWMKPFLVNKIRRLFGVIHDDVAKESYTW
ncbi:hypothetical protein GEMRC1_009545 [Eukaryota sp. GEM-RC1]